MQQQTQDNLRGGGGTFLTFGRSHEYTREKKKKIPPAQKPPTSSMWHFQGKNASAAASNIDGSVEGKGNKFHESGGGGDVCWDRYLFCRLFFGEKKKGGPLLLLLFSPRAEEFSLIGHRGEILTHQKFETCLKLKYFKK